MELRMTAKHAQWPRENDPIFAIAGRAKEAQDKFGKDKVIDATIGALVDDEGALICMESVYGVLKNLPDAKIAAYAALAGQPDFLAAVEKACFREFRPDAHIRTVATPGGTGAVKHAVWGYTNPGDKILVSDWFWSAYSTIAGDVGRSLTHHRLFNEKGGFNIESFKESFDALADEQGRVLTIINSPAQNPTGYSLSDEEWDQVLEVMKAKAQDSEKRLILFVDTAYIDFAGEGMERRAFFRKFSGLPENILVIVGYSMSKGYTMYGLRSGAAIGISSNEDVAEDFYYACLHAGRANWSNGTRCAMEVMSEIENDPAKLEVYSKELLKYKNMLRARAAAFVKASEEVGLEILPYRDGFFTSIPHENPKAVVEKLTEYNIFAVPLKMGVRFAVCAVSEENCAKAPAIIKKAIDELK